MKFVLLLIFAPSFFSQAHASPEVSDGAFKSGTQESLAHWFESGSVKFVEGAWSNVSVFPTVFTTGNMLIMDSAGDGSYVYQRLGKVELADILKGTLRITADFAEKADDGTNPVTFQIFAGPFDAAADGVDLFGHAKQPALLATFTLDAKAQGLTAEKGDNNRASEVLVGEADISGLSGGTPLWLRVVDSASGFDRTGNGGDVLIDNIEVTTLRK